MRLREQILRQKAAGAFEKSRETRLGREGVGCLSWSSKLGTPRHSARNRFCPLSASVTDLGLFGPWALCQGWLGRAVVGSITHVLPLPPGTPWASLGRSFCWQRQRCGTEACLLVSCRPEQLTRPSPVRRGRRPAVLRFPCRCRRCGPPLGRDHKEL